MQFSFDPTGFPLVRIPDLPFEIHLLPVAKVQFERFLAAANPYGDTWYEQVLAMHGRVSYRGFEDEGRERVFVGGIFPQEALAFARWLGPEYDLPTVDQWRQVYRHFSTAAVSAFSMPGSDASAARSSADVLVRRLVEQLEPGLLVELSLMSGGFFEWVWEKKAFIGLGCPRAEFYPNAYDPLEAEWRPFRPDERLKVSGFRLVRRLSA